MAVTINASTTAGLVTSADTSGNLDLQAGGVTKIAVTSAGANVTGAFTVNGASVASQWTTTGSDIYYSTGKVGIGNSSMSSFPSAYSNLVIGTGSGNNGMTIYGGTGSSSSYVGFKNAANTTVQGLFEYDFGANRLYTYVNGALVSNIDSLGQWYLGCTVRPSSGNVTGVMIEQGIITIGSTNSAGQDRMRFETPSGRVGAIVTSGSSTSYVSYSDYRLKENIAPMTGALSKVALLKPVTYSWKIDGSSANGFIAHELADVCPQAVTGVKDEVDTEGNPVYQGIDTSFLVATLTAAIQELAKATSEQQALIENLTTRLSALENK